MLGGSSPVLKACSAVIFSADVLIGVSNRSSSQNCPGEKTTSKLGIKEEPSAPHSPLSISNRIHGTFPVYLLYLHECTVVDFYGKCFNHMDPMGLNSGCFNRDPYSGLL